MRTQNFSHTQQQEKNAEQQEAERNSTREPQTSSRHAHWDDLHGTGNGSSRAFLSNIRREISSRPWTDIAVAAAAGFAMGWLMSNRQRSNSVLDILVGSLLPTASKKAHHAYDSLRDSGTLREVGNQFSKLKARW